MKTRGIKQVALVAALQLRGLAVLEEATEDYMAFRAKSLKKIKAAQDVARELEDHTGILIVIRG